MKRNEFISLSRQLPFAVANALLGQEKKHFSSFILGWGHKPTADKARRYATEHGLPYIALEDGFLRSLDLGCRGAQPLSLVVDHTGIYYDASGPSDLENLLNGSGWETPELLASARQAMTDIVRHGLSKYNQAPDAPSDLLGDAARPRVLVIDQTVGDASVALGGADASTFAAMLEEARTRFPDGRIFVKTHPDVLAGKKQGYLAGKALPDGVTPLGGNYAPLSLLNQADVVFTVTSQMGFEALLLGKPVHCFGLPFYAGWGLTRDRQICPRRTRHRALAEVFAAAYLLYARYVNPVRGERCDIHEVIGILAEQRRRNEANRGLRACVGFSCWKRPHARAFLQATEGEIHFFRRADKAARYVRKRGGAVVAWASKASTETERVCEELSVPLIRMEDGFLRSVGLGSNFHWPYSLILDRKGMYYDPSSPSELEDILNGFSSRPDSAELRERAAALRRFIVERGLTKYNVGFAAFDRSRLPAGRPLALVPGQVEDDASVRLGGCGIASNLDLLKTVRAARPDAYILYKPHPDVESGNRTGFVSITEALRYADHVIRDARMDRLLEVVDEVHTLTSLTGFEALLRGVAVYTYGGPFYAGWGLTTDRLIFPRRTARLDRDALVAGTLLLYPAYYDWQTRQFCRAEDVCHRLTQPEGQMRSSWWSRLVVGLRERLPGRGQP